MNVRTEKLDGNWNEQPLAIYRMRCQSGCFTGVHSGCLEHQKRNFSPNWMSRGLVPGSVLLTTPNVDDVTLVLGGANCVRLKILKN